MKRRTLTFAFAVILFSGGQAVAADSCAQQSQQVASALIPGSRLLSQECLPLRDIGPNKQVLLLICLNNPEMAAETYLVVAQFKPGHELQHTLVSQQVGWEAFPIQKQGSEIRLLPILKPFAGEKIQVATNALTDRHETELKIWNVDLAKMRMTQISTKKFKAIEMPDARLENGTWNFAAVPLTESTRVTPQASAQSLAR